LLDVLACHDPAAAALLPIPNLGAARQDHPAKYVESHHSVLSYGFKFRLTQKGHFRFTLPNQFCGSVVKKANPTQQNKHSMVT